MGTNNQNLQYLQSSNSKMGLNNLQVYLDESNKENIPQNNNNNLPAAMYKNEKLKIIFERNKELQNLNNNSIQRMKELETKITSFQQLYQQKKSQFDIVK